MYSVKFATQPVCCATNTSVAGPVLDPVEFSGRFLAHSKGTHLLGHEGSVIALLLVVWAASFGVDEQGVPIENEDHDYELGGVSMGHGEYSMQQEHAQRKCQLSAVERTKRGFFKVAGREERKPPRQCCARF